MLAEAGARKYISQRRALQAFNCASRKSKFEHTLIEARPTHDEVSSFTSRQASSCNINDQHQLCDLDNGSRVTLRPGASKSHQDIKLGVGIARHDRHLLNLDIHRSISIVFVNIKVELWRYPIEGRSLPFALEEGTEPSPPTS